MVCVTLLRACQFEIVRCNIYLLIWKQYSSYSQGALGCEDDDLDKKLRKYDLGYLIHLWDGEGIDLLCAQVRDK